MSSRHPLPGERVLAMNEKRLFSNRELAKILLPLVLQNILTITIGMADSIMVSGSGEAAFAGVSLVNSLDTLLVQLFTSLAAGGTVVLAQAMGRDDRKTACNAAKQLLYVSVAIAVVVSAALLLLRQPLLTVLFGKAEASVLQSAMSYFSIVSLSLPFIALSSSAAAVFRAQGDSVIALKISLMENALNITGNALLIYGLRMGATGAAIATLISRVLGALIITRIAQNAKRYIYIQSIFHYRPDTSLIKAILHIGIPNGIESTLFQFGKLITSSLVSSLGTASIAANAAAHSVITLQYTTGNAVQNTMVAVVGRCIGAEEKEQAKHYTRKLVGTCYVLITAMAILTCLLHAPLLNMYNLSAESFAMARRLMFYHGLMASLIWAIAFALPSAFRAANDVHFTMVASIVSMWVFRVALAYLLAKESVSLFGLVTLPGAGLDIMGVWIAMTIDWGVRTILFLWRFLSGKWLTKYRKPDESASPKAAEKA